MSWAEADYEFVFLVLIEIIFLKNKKDLILGGSDPQDPHGVHAPNEFWLWKLTFEKVNEFKWDYNVKMSLLLP